MDTQRAILNQNTIDFAVADENVGTVVVFMRTRIKRRFYNAKASTETLTGTIAGIILESAADGEILYVCHRGAEFAAQSELRLTGPDGELGGDEFLTLKEKGKSGGVATFKKLVYEDPRAS